MSIDLPEYLSRGELARLIPVSNGSQRERSAASVLLSTLCIVRPFSEIVLGTIGKSLGVRSTLQAFSEVVFSKPFAEANCRPDGLLIVSTSRSEWRALIEAKIGTARVSPGQVSTYSRLAAQNQVDALITISNELTPLPHHLPYQLPPDFSSKVDVYHWSWSKIVTLATLLISGADDDFDREQHFLLKEMLRYFTHESTGIRGFHQMNSEWPELLSRLHTGASIHRTHAHVVKTVGAWHQEQSDICLILSRKLKVPVTLRLKKSHRFDQGARIDEDAEEFAKSKTLRAEFDVPNLAGPIEVVADAQKRNIVCRIRVRAPEDKVRYESRLNWLLRQLPEDPGALVGIHINWKNGGESFGWLGELRGDPASADLGRPGALPKEFEVSVVTDLGQKFSGTKAFIEILEAAVPQFYDKIARHIRGWLPAPIPGPAAGEETMADTVANLPGPKPERRVVRRGEVGAGRFFVFEDGSVEIETPSGVKRFRSIDELVASTKPAVGPSDAQASQPTGEGTS